MPGLSQLLIGSLPNAINAVQTAVNNMSGTDMMNGSFSEEAVKTHQKAQDNLIDQARAEAIRQDPTLNYMQMRIATGLIGAKQDWENAYQSGDAAGMVNAAKSAQSLREQANSIGWDSSAYGEDVSLYDASKNLANNNTRAINNLLNNDMDSGTYLQNEYKRLKDAGLNTNDALEEAKNRATRYQSERAKSLRDAFKMYGTDGMGALTDNGVTIMQMLAEDNKDNASLLGNMYASPVQQWNYNNALQAAANAQRDALIKMELQNKFQTDARHEGYEHDADMLNRRSQLERERDLQKQNDNFNRTYQLYYALTGGDQEKAMQLSAQHLLGLNGGGGRGNGSDNSSSKEILKYAEQIGNRLADIEKKYEIDPQGLATDEEYQRLKQAYSRVQQAYEASVFGEQENSNTGGINLNDYNQAISYMTEMLEQNRAAGTANSKENLKEMFRRKGIPEEYIRDVDWAHYYGSGAIEKKPTATSEDEGKSELQKYADASNASEGNGTSNGLFSNLWDMLTNTTAGARTQNPQEAVDRIQNPYLRERIQRQLS